MARRFMKIKRVVLPFMSLVILTSQLAGCAILTSAEMMEELQKGEDIVIEYSTPIEVKKDNIVSLDNKQYTIENTIAEEDKDDDLGLMSQSQVEIKELETLTGEKLVEYFQTAYEAGSILEGSLEERIRTELDMLVELVSRKEEGKLPSDYEQQYRDWRPAETKEVKEAESDVKQDTVLENQVKEETQQQEAVEEVAEEAVEEVQLFTECSEQVWATGSVNLRSGPGTENDKVGSLSRGQSVTRTGIGTGTAEGWSRVTLSSGETVYVSNKYISTSKPAAQQSKPAAQQSKPAAPSSSSGGSTQQSSGSSGGSGMSLSDILGRPVGGSNYTDNTDWSQYTGAGSSFGEITGEKVEEGWKNIQ